MAGILRTTFSSIRRGNSQIIMEMNNEFLKAFSEIVREEVASKNEVRLKGIGSFQFKHKKQFQKQYENGRVVMMPPKDTITFIPEN